MKTIILVLSIVTYLTSIGVSSFRVPSLYETFPAIVLNRNHSVSGSGSRSSDGESLRRFSAWETFKAEHKKLYEDEDEEEARRQIFLKTLKEIEEHNANPTFTFKLGTNEFSDLTDEEKRVKLQGVRATPEELLRKMHEEADNVFTGNEENLLQPATWDWRTKNAVTGVKNQGQCGGCYSFSATGALEGATAIKTGRLTSLSEQNILDCSRSQGNMGCNGGTQGNAFNYIKANGGINTEASYPYTGTAGNCRYNKANNGATCTGYTSIPSGNETALMLAVANKGPVAVSIDSTSSQFANYKSGLFNVPSCSKSVTHAVLVVGYGSLNGSPYWLVKNSWGPSWGQGGYIYMARNANNQCGIALWATTPNV